MTSNFKLVFRSKTGQTRTEEMTTRRLFGEFIRQHISTLVERGLIHEGERVHSHITPRYDNASQYGREVVYLATLERPWLEEDGRPGWSSEPQMKGEPLRYFTLTLHATPRGFVYRKDFSVTTLEQSISKWTELLDIEHDVLAQGDWKWEVVALGADPVPPTDFPPYSQNSAPLSLVILVEPISPSSEGSVFPVEEVLEISVESLPVELPVKPIPPGPYQVHGIKNTDDLNVLISRNTLQEIEQEVAKQWNIEDGGLLLGEAFREEADQELIVHITAHVPATGIRGTVGPVRFTSEAWNAMLHIKEQRYPDTKVVGWYHARSIGAWLTLDDEFIYQNIFKEPWHVLLILSRGDDARRVFRWKGGQIVPCNWFQIVG